MSNESRSDLKINGSGTASGGIYNQVIINGSGSINGDIDCNEFKINGSGKIKGNIKTISGKINGSGSVSGNLEAQDFKTSGSSDLNGNVSVKIFKIDGHSDIGGNINAEDINVNGTLKAEGDCSTEVFSAKGAFNINGLLNAGQIEVSMYMSSTAKEIGGEKIVIKKGTGMGFANFLKSVLSLNIFNGLTTEIIEGDDVYLENTKAKIVRGNNIIIGPECDIGLVEYKNNFKAEVSSAVKENKKI